MVSHLVTIIVAAVADDASADGRDRLYHGRHGSRVVALRGRQQSGRTEPPRAVCRDRVRHLATGARRTIIPRTRPQAGAKGERDRMKRSGPEVCQMSFWPRRREPQAAKSESSKGQTRRFRRNDRRKPKRTLFYKMLGTPSETKSPCARQTRPSSATILALKRVLNETRGTTRDSVRDTDSREIKAQITRG